MTIRTRAAFLLVATALAAGCRTDESLAAPDLSNNGGLLARYVAMGNSITAGFQSAGINDSTQRRSYAAVFARQARAPYFFASLNLPGCPAPFVDNVTQARVGDQPPTSPCALRRQDQVPFLGHVPLHEPVRTASDRGEPIVVADPDSPPAVAIMAAAERIAQQVSIASFSGRTIPLVEIR